MNTKLNLKKLALAIGAMALAGSAMAVTDDSTMAASATITQQCAVANGTELAFSTLEMLNFLNATVSTSDALVAKEFNAICTNGSAAPTFTYTSANGGTTDFHLKGSTIAAEEIAYTLYQSADSTANAVTINVAAVHPSFSAPNGVQTPLALSARIAAAAKDGKSVQSYTDTVTITVNY
jgi:spore coat protein U-like protein